MRRQSLRERKNETNFRFHLKQAHGDGARTISVPYAITRTVRILGMYPGFLACPMSELERGPCCGMENDSSPARGRLEVKTTTSTSTEYSVPTRIDSRINAAQLSGAAG